MESLRPIRVPTLPLDLSLRNRRAIYLRVGNRTGRSDFLDMLAEPEGTVRRLIFLSLRRSFRPGEGTKQTGVRGNPPHLTISPALTASQSSECSGLS